MLRFFKALSLSRGGWLLLVISGIILEGIALYFQHGMLLNPCVMCIYERVAVFGIIFAGLIGMIAPKFWLFRFSAILFSLACAVKGVLLSWKHLDYQLNPSPWNQCPVVPDFPSTLPLDKWMPFIFQPSGSCSEVSWQFLGLSMVQWLVVIFIIYTLLMSLVLISQIVNHRPKRNIFH